MLCGWGGNRRLGRKKWQPTAGWMTYGHPRADCLYTGISSGWAQRSVSSMGSLYLYANPRMRTAKEQNPPLTTLIQLSHSQAPTELPSTTLSNVFRVNLGQPVPLGYLPRTSSRKEPFGTKWHGLYGPDVFPVTQPTVLNH